MVSFPLWGIFCLRLWKPEKRPNMDTHAMRLMRLELHDMPSMGETLISAHGLSEKKKKKSGQCCSPGQLKLIFWISDGVKDKHIDLLSTYLNLTFYLEAKCCVLQSLDHRASEPLFLPANGAVDTQHRPVLHSQTSSPGPPFLCSWLSAHFLLCDEHSRGEPWQIDVIWKREIVDLS